MCLVDFSLTGTTWDPGPDRAGRASLPKINIFPTSMFSWISLVFGSLLGSIFDDFLSFLHNFFEHAIHIDFPSILGWIMIPFFMFFYDFPCPRTHLAKPCF